MEAPTITVVAPPSSADDISKSRAKNEDKGRSSLSKLVEKIKERDDKFYKMNKKGTTMSTTKRAETLQINNDSFTGTKRSKSYNNHRMLHSQS